MITKDLLRYKIEKNAINPQLLKSSRGIVELAGSLLEYWQARIGQSRSELADGLPQILYKSRSLLIARGLNKLLEDSAEFSDVSSLQEQRWAALHASVARLQAGGADKASVHHQHVAADIGLTTEQLTAQLYGDLPDAAVLQSVGLHDAKTLIQRYNMSQCQGLLIHAESMDIHIETVDTAIQRQLLKAIRFRRLLVDHVRCAENSLQVRVSGPGSVLQQAQRYGLNLALLLPAIASCPAWSIRAQVRAPRREQKTICHLEINDQTGITGETRYLAYIPPELRSLEQTILKKEPTWRVDHEPGLYPLSDGDVLVPDFALTVNEQNYSIELFHRWHAAPLKRRIQQLQRNHIPAHLLFGIDRSIATHKDIAALLESPEIQNRYFLYRDFPTVRPMKALIKEQQA